MTHVSVFIDALAKAAGENPFAEKILLAPSHRVGRQWLDQIALAVGGVVNVRVVPLRRLMLDFAQPVLDRKKLHPASREELTRIVGAAVAELGGDNRGGGYFTRLPSGLTLAESLLRSLEEIENAGLKGRAVFNDKLVASEKAEEMAALLGMYRSAKRKRRIVGAGETGQAALDGLGAHAFDALPILLAPASALDDAVGFERRFLGQWPEEKIRILKEEEAEGPGGNVDCFVADCVANETREVLRRALAQGIPLDRIEMVCFDPGAYIPAMCSAGLELFGGRVEELPFTFASGIPALLSRPVRLLRMWVAWLLDDLPAAPLADAIEAGLLGDGWQSVAPAIGASTLAARLKALPIQAGVADYRRNLGKRDAREDIQLAEKWLAEAVSGMVPLSGDGRTLDLSSPEAVLRAAVNLLRLGAENDGKLDAYARLAAREAVEAWLEWCDWPGFDALRWLDVFAADLRVMGLGPLPGRMHVADGVSGGHSGRAVTFVLGMDEGRSSGAVRQDPVLLDRERMALSRHLRGSGWRRERRENAVRRFFGRLRGTVVLSYSRYDFASGREQYPSLLLARMEHNDGVGVKALRPECREAALNRRDDWLWSLLAWRKNAFSPADLAPWFPHLVQGEAALAARSSAAFSEWDGFVPEAGADFQAEEWVLSPSQLESLAGCPLEFFFRRVLKIRPPDRWKPEPGRWLAGNERGQLLHDLFQLFLEKLDESGETPAMEQGPVLFSMLEERLGIWRGRKPVRDESTYERERLELMDAAGIFLVNEVVRARRERPVCFEAAIGGAEAEEPPWRRMEPVRLEFGDGVSVRLQGRVDRVDRLHDNGGLVILDYKTGRSSDFSHSNPFLGGRHLQPYLYTAMLERALAENGMVDRVNGFGYFFPMPRDEGRSINYDRDALRDGGAVVRALVAMLRKGCFPFARKKEDVAYSDYLDVYGDVRALLAAGREKILMDERLADWRELQNLEKTKSKVEG